MRARGIVAMGGATAALLAACGGSSPPSEANATAAAGASPAAVASGGTGHCPGSAGLTGALSDYGAGAADGSSITVGVEDSYFNPTCVTGVPPGTVTLNLTNTGALVHNISVPEQGLDTDLPAGQTVSVHVTVGSTPLHYFCKYHRTSGMQAALLPAGH
jgi:plastocyanin